MKKQHIVLHQPDRIASDNYLDKCEKYLTKYFKSSVLLTSTCTHALEMIALLLNIKPGDEVLVPSYTYVASVQPFAKLGAKIVFVDVDPRTANIDAEDLRQKISHQTKVVVVVHYAGSCSDMDEITQLCDKYGAKLVEDAAQAYGSFWRRRPLGTFGVLAAMSFDRTKNVSVHRGGALIINDQKYLEPAKVIRANGCNRDVFDSGLVSEYVWLSFGSQYGMSQLVAKALWPQLAKIKAIVAKRKKIVDTYLLKLKLPNDVYALSAPINVNTNYHIFALVFKTQSLRDEFINFMNKKGIEVMFHYRALHKSPMAKKLFKQSNKLPGTDKINNGLVRLPLHNKLTNKEINYIVSAANEFFSR